MNNHKSKAVKNLSDKAAFVVKILSIAQDDKYINNLRLTALPT